MATTTNYSWSTPDDTALVKDGAAAIRTLGSSIDTTTKALNPSTTLGDVEYRSATANTNSRLGIGTTGQVLSVVGGVPAWATLSGAGLTWTLLNTGGTAMTGSSTVTISGISNKEYLMVTVLGASTGTSQDEFRFRINADSGSNYQVAGLDISSATAYNAANFNKIQSAARTDISLAQMTGNAGSSVAGYMKIDGGLSSGIKTFTGVGASDSVSSSANGVEQIFGGVYTGSAPITSISIRSANAVNFDAGTIYVYGA